MSATCVIAQPIHPVGAELLRAAGIAVLQPKDPLALRDGLALADAVIVRDGLSADWIDAAPRLRVISNHGTGSDRIDVAYATELGIPVTSTPGANARSVAEHALMLMFATARQAVAADAATRRGHWGFKYQRPMLELYGQTLGIVGFGCTGQMLCEMAARGLGMRVLVWSPKADAALVQSAQGQRVETLEELLEQSDVVSLHRSMKPQNRHTLNDAGLQRMKPSAIVINTSRGGLIDEEALIDALVNARLFGAGLDVFETEPFVAHGRLATLPNVVLTPHVAGSSQQALHATATQCARQVIDVLAGRQPLDLVMPQVWERRRTP
ncbi:phosphoglycerate dehydrogenase [Xylophilus rhododendri]|uniref:Phosphoglycerate dehydrogenase n=1 Tax=Xylophilus rhododendri TaxID=2697032 RepID=A0A857IZU4_9BURK|nr:hydroxyacid dehydrogenase [Xylophilus rhododendri]QHI96553.1 phosphoglycerate dehydrogenase [Xylophilus rhododendri]